MSKLTSSIAMCTYNGEKYLQEQLDSLTAQTRLPDELVVCDDCSTDSTVEILETFSKRAPFPVRIFRNEKNLGYNKNFEKCALKCNYDIIFYCDQDDIWQSNKIEIVLNNLEKNSVWGIIAHNDVCINSTGDNKSESLISSLKSFFKYPDNYIELINSGMWTSMVNRLFSWPGHNIAFRSSLREIIFPVPCENLYDAWTFLSCLSVGEGHVLDIPLVQYRIHNNSATRREVAQKNIVDSQGLSLSDSRILEIGYKQMGCRAQFAADRLAAISLQTMKPTVIYNLNNRALHYFRRSQMRQNMLKRYAYALIELFSGRYFRHSSGLLSFGKDLIGK